MAAANRGSLISTDGATIAFQSVGRGPGVIVVPGVLSAAVNYEELADALATDFTVHTIERRGRGRSSPQEPEYSIATECADVSALQQETQASYLFGHSYGGLIALETARRNAAFRKVAVYEPGISVDDSIPVAWGERYSKLLEKGRPLDAFAEFCVAMGPSSARKLPRWLTKIALRLMLPREELNQKLGLLRSNLREHQEIAKLNNTYRSYREVMAPVMCFYGARSGFASRMLAMARLAEVLPSMRMHELQKLDHFGPDKTGPREVALVVGGFFLGQPS